MQAALPIGSGSGGALRPYVVSWNITYRCNLACEHCYLDAGAVKKLSGEGWSDRSELPTPDCLQIVEQIAELAPECVVILTGGEPLLRRDIIEIVEHAVRLKLWVVIGTNGVKISENLIRLLKEAGARGMALSLDALDADRHDRFRAVKGAWANTVAGTRLLNEAGLPFIIQTTVGRHNLHELRDIAELACASLGAKVWNVYFLVQTGRGQFISDISPAEYEEALETLRLIQSEFQGRMLVNAKCAPHFTRRLFEADPGSPFLKTYSGGAGGCPAGTHYLGIRPNGDVTPCPYLPVFGGNLIKSTLREVWETSEPFLTIRHRDERLGGRCGSCEFQRLCGGCRARAFGVHGSFMEEDPLCEYEPGKYAAAEVLDSVGIVYGEASERSIAWDAEAMERMERIPAFVRGTVIRSVETHCRKEGIVRVTVDELERIRARMPASKLFRKPQ